MSEDVDYIFGICGRKNKFLLIEFRKILHDDYQLRKGLDRAIEVFLNAYSYLSNRRDYLISEKFGKFEKKK